MLQLVPSMSHKRAGTGDTPALSGEVFGALINLSGRRRFTSQRLVLYAVLASLGHDNALDVSREALQLFCDAHHGLVDGSDTLPGVFCDELHAVYFGKAEGDRHIRDFIQLAERTLEAIQSGSRQAPTLLDQLVLNATPMLAVLNRITQVYEDLAKRHAVQMRKQLRGIMADIESIAKQARMVSFNAQIVAARAGQAGREFSVVAGVLSDITGEIDGLVRAALNSSAA
ncbi:MAG: methyl-accepting chemotaxis protein [Noviherbaspirillum sp.]